MAERKNQAAATAAAVLASAEKDVFYTPGSDISTIVIMLYTVLCVFAPFYDHGSDRTFRGIVTD